jgi:hypothetical protein
MAHDGSTRPTRDGLRKGRHPTQSFNHLRDIAHDRQGMGIGPSLVIRPHQVHEHAKSRKAKQELEAVGPEGST